MITLNNLAPTADVATTGSSLGYTFHATSGADGVGDTLTGSTGVALTIDGVTIALGNLVLVKDESGANTPNNGLYICTTVAASGISCVLTRHVNMSNSIQFNYSIVAVTQGTTNANTLWMFQYTSGFTVNTNNVVFNSLGVSGSNKTIQTFSGPTVSWNVSLGYNAKITLSSGTNTLAITGLPGSAIGVYGTVVVVQPASGTGTLSLPTSPGSSIVVGGGSGTVLLSTTSNYIDIITFYWDGSKYYWTYAPNFN